MLKHAKAEQTIEGPGAKGHRKYVRLYDQHVRPRSVRRIVRIYRVAVVQRYHGGTGVCGLLREPAGAAANLQDELAVQITRPVRLPEEPLLRNPHTGVGIELRPRVLGPFETEAGGVVFARYKTWYARDDGVLPV